MNEGRPPPSAGTEAGRFESCRLSGATVAVGEDEEDAVKGGDQPLALE